MKYGNLNQDHQAGYSREACWPEEIHIAHGSLMITTISIRPSRVSWRHPVGAFQKYTDVHLQKLTKLEPFFDNINWFLFRKCSNIYSGRCWISRWIYVHGKDQCRYRWCNEAGFQIHVFWLASLSIDLIGGGHLKTNQSFPDRGFFDPQRDQFDIMVFTNGGLDLELLPNYQPHCPNK